MPAENKDLHPVHCDCLVQTDLGWKSVITKNGSLWLVVKTGNDKRQQK